VKYHIIDTHLHCDIGSIDSLLEAMNIAGVDRGVILAWPGETEKLLEEVENKGRRRLRITMSPDIRKIGTSEWDKELECCQRLIKFSVAFKFYKEISFGFNYPNGRKLDLLSSDLEPLWDIAQDSRKPIIVHCGDPADFWNEGPNLRKKQLKLHPEWHYYKTPQIRNRAQILLLREKLIKRRPNVIFIGAHLGGFPVNPIEFSDFLKFGPVDTSAALEEVLTQNRSDIQRIFMKYYKKIMWGSDLIHSHAKPKQEGISAKISAKFLCDSLRMLVSQDLMTPPNPVECFWPIKGLGLSQEMAEHILWKNATKFLWKEE